MSTEKCASLLLLLCLLIFLFLHSSYAVFHNNYGKFNIEICMRVLYNESDGGRQKQTIIHSWRPFILLLLADSAVAC